MKLTEFGVDKLMSFYIKHVNDLGPKRKSWVRRRWALILGMLTGLLVWALSEI